jgi:hypothetical protein
MELGGYSYIETEFSNGEKYDSKKKKTTKYNKQNNDTSNLYCNKCKINTKNKDTVTYNYNSNIMKWSAFALCNKCHTKKSVFAKRELT